MALDQLRLLMIAILVTVVAAILGPYHTGPSPTAMELEKVP